MESVLSVEPKFYSGRFPNYRRPKILGFLSLDGERRYHADTSQLRFAKSVDNKKVCFDLNANFNKTKHSDLYRDEKIETLLQFLLDQNKRLNFTLADSIEQVRFYCYRGLLTCVACTPYENREPWRIVATLYKGNIYLCARDTPKKLEALRNMSEKDKRFTSWGYKFEQYVLSSTPDFEPDTQSALDENEEFSLILESHLNGNKIVYGAEMDGIHCDGPVGRPPSKDMGVEATLSYLDDKEFIELKTCRHIEFPNQHNNFRRFKTKKWWCQSFLAGVETIVCGFRNDDGIVEELKAFNTKKLCKMSEKFWNPNVCFNFLDNFLIYVKRCLSKEIKIKYGEKYLKNLQNLPLIYLHFEWSPGMPVQVTNNYNYEADPILPQWFLDNFGSKY